MNRRKNIITLLIIMLACLIVMAGVCVSFMLDITRTVIDDPLSAFEPQRTQEISSITAEPVSEDAPATPAPVPHDVDYNGVLYNKQTGYVNIVLLGFDDMQDREDDGSNTDSIMVFKINMENGAIDIISIPRDTWTKVNEYDKKGNLEYTYNTKINAAYSAAARKSDRYDNALTAIENLLEPGDQIDLDIDYYCSIDIKDIPKLADAVGGVKVTLEYNVPNVGNKGDTVTLTGKNAQYYLRDRSTGSGDITRGVRHEKFMIALAKRIKEMGGKQAALALYDDMLRYLTTNLSIEQIAALATLLDKINTDEMKMHTLPGKIGSASYERPGSHFGERRSVYLADTPALTQMILDIYYEPVN